MAHTEFTYLSDSQANVSVALGDARLVLERETPQGYDALIVDAFSGDAIPIHLLTREAVLVYRKHLSPSGVLLFHISNRFVDLQPALARLAVEEGSMPAWFTTILMAIPATTQRTRKRHYPLRLGCSWRRTSHG
jgi:spermidine synthase